MTAPERLEKTERCPLYLCETLQGQEPNVHGPKRPLRSFCKALQSKSLLLHKLIPCGLELAGSVVINLQALHDAPLPALALHREGEHDVLHVRPQCSEATLPASESAA